MKAEKRKDLGSKFDDTVGPSIYSFSGPESDG